MCVCVCVCDWKEGGREERKEGEKDRGRGEGNRFSHKRLVSHGILLKSTPFPAISQGGCL